MINRAQDEAQHRQQPLAAENQLDALQTKLNSQLQESLKQIEHQQQQIEFLENELARAQQSLSALQVRNLQSRKHVMKLDR